MQVTPLLSELRRGSFTFRIGILESSSPKTKKSFGSVPIKLEPTELHWNQPNYIGTNRKVSFEATYYPVSGPFTATDGTLEQFLVERYCLYASSPNGQLYRGDVHHAPWQLQHAAGTVVADQLLKPHRLSTAGAQPILHYSRGVEVVVWSLEPLNQ